MITNEQKNIILEGIVEILELPVSAYEKAKVRYEDLGEWFGREGSSLAGYDPHIFPQGSFRLGTAIRPLDDNEEYDLDLACKMRTGITKISHSQKELKDLVGIELEAYRKARGIKEELDEKHRCWRIEYQDDLSFHMDIVPCIPEDEKGRKVVHDSILTTGLDSYVTGAASASTVSITDDRHENYASICSDWKISNPEGYAKWFEYQMDPKRLQLLLEKAQVDDVPLFEKKTPLQRSIQILKRHRDSWCKGNEDSKPISIIITTLAARAYHGETDIVEALGNILQKMGKLVNPHKPRIPNPVDPSEDFADRWYREDSLHLRLEYNFKSWLQQAQTDFHHLTSTNDVKFICEQAEGKLSLSLNESKFKDRLGVNDNVMIPATPKVHTINRNDTPKPWRKI
jgi:hypothetical protein